MGKVKEKSKEGDKQKELKIHAYSKRYKGRVRDIKGGKGEKEIQRERERERYNGRGKCNISDSATFLPSDTIYAAPEQVETFQLQLQLQIQL